jgi:hypothetical protein
MYHRDDQEYEEAYVVRASRAKYHKARKEHKCYRCLKPIPKGDVYRYVVVITDEGLHATHEHAYYCMIEDDKEPPKEEPW